MRLWQIVTRLLYVTGIRDYALWGTSNQAWWPLRMLYRVDRIIRRGFSDSLQRVLDREWDARLVNGVRLPRPRPDGRKGRRLA